MVKKTDVFILTEEGFDGAYKATAYDQESDALEELKRLMATKPDCRTILDGKGFIDKDETQYRVLTLDEAIGTDGKMVWVIHQKCFDMDFCSLFDWENYFSTKEEADALYQERVSLYRVLALKQPKIDIHENEDRDQIFILVNDIPRVLLEYHARPIGEITNVGTLMLDTYLDNVNNN
jgi:hypothetical protein